MLGRQHQAAGVLVDAVDRAENGAGAGSLPPGRVAVGQGAPGIVEGGVDRNARRLVQHQGKKVLIGHPEGDALLGQTALPLGGQVKGDHLTGHDPAVGQDGGAVGEKAPALELDRPHQVGGKPAAAQKAAQHDALLAPPGPAPGKYSRTARPPFAGS